MIFDTKLLVVYFNDRNYNLNKYFLDNPCFSVTCGANANCKGGACYCNQGYEGNALAGCLPSIFFSL